MWDGTIINSSARVMSPGIFRRGTFLVGQKATRNGEEQFTIENISAIDPGNLSFGQGDDV